LVLLLLPAGQGRTHGCSRHIPVVLNSKLRRLLDNPFSLGAGPATALSQTKKAAALTAKDLQETEDHAADFLAKRPSRFTGRDRRLLDNPFSLGAGPATALSQTKKAAALTAKDLQETEDHAADFLAKRPSRFTGRDRRLLDNPFSLGTGPATALTQTKKAAALTAKDLQETEDHAADFLAKRPSRFTGGDRRLLDNPFSLGTGPATALFQTKKAAALTTADLQETEACC
jgi:methenyltetrahydromethanopterin cyclohydrolase